MLQRFYALLSSHQPVGVTVVQPTGNNSANQDKSSGAAAPLSRVPAPRDPEDYELRISFDLSERTMQPLNVAGLHPTDPAVMVIFLVPDTHQAGTGERPQKVYEAPADRPAAPVPFTAGREYLVCLRFGRGGRATALLSLVPQEQQVGVTELGLLPYWTMKWLERDTPKRG